MGGDGGVIGDTFANLPEPETALAVVTMGEKADFSLCWSRWCWANRAG